MSIVKPKIVWEGFIPSCTDKVRIVDTGSKFTFEHQQYNSMKEKFWSYMHTSYETQVEIWKTAAKWFKDGLEAKPVYDEAPLHEKLLQFLASRDSQNPSPVAHIVVEREFKDGQYSDDLKFLLYLPWCRDVEQPAMSLLVDSIDAALRNNLAFKEKQCSGD